MPGERKPREYPRYEVRVAADCTGDEVRLGHRVANISLGGICLETDALEEVGTVVDLVLHFPDLDTSIVARGEVVWVDREPPCDMGIRYVDLDDARRDLLRRSINQLRRG